MTPKTEILVSLLKAQCERDSVWCAPCGMSGARQILAVSEILVSGNGIEAKVPMCRDCINRRLREPLEHDVGCAPVEQPAYVRLAQQLITEIEAVTSYLNYTGDSLPRDAAESGRQFDGEPQAHEFVQSNALEAQLMRPRNKL